VTRLFDYARPDAVVSVDGEPIVSIEQTQMNPSGHNIPQRFSALVRAAELGVPGILYYPKYSRRTFSDPNVRYLQVRVPLANLRLTEIYEVPSLSMFWPTDPVTLLPKTDASCHQPIANVVAELIEHAADHRSALVSLPSVRAAVEEMSGAVEEYGSRYGKNPSVRALRPTGFAGALLRDGASIDPPQVVQLHETASYLAQLEAIRTAGPDWDNVRAALASRSHTLVLTGTANHSRTDSEHPWPGYLTLIDILYARSDNGRSPADRQTNLCYVLPVQLETFLSRAARAEPPTAVNIVDTFADLTVLTGGVVAGKPVRGERGPAAVLHGG
jgi:hypothetical protein